MVETVIRNESHNEIFNQQEVSTILTKYMNLLKYNPNKSTGWGTLIN